MNQAERLMMITILRRMYRRLEQLEDRVDGDDAGIRMGIDSLEEEIEILAVALGVR